MKYYIVRCNKCGRWSCTPSKKKVRDVVHTCKYESCQAIRKLWTEEAHGVRLHFKIYEHPIVASDAVKRLNDQDATRQTMMAEFTIPGEEAL